MPLEQKLKAKGERICERFARHVRRYYRKDKVGKKSDKRRLGELEQLLFGGVDSMLWRCGVQMRFRLGDIDIYIELIK